MEKFFGNLKRKILEVFGTKKYKQKQVKMKLSDFFRHSPLVGIDLSRDVTEPQDNKIEE